jgi:L-lysine 6-transaminase
MRLRTRIGSGINRAFYRCCVTENFPFVVDLAGSRGVYLRTVDGQRIFDWAGYYGSKLLGHNHPGLRDRSYLRRLVLAANNKVPNPDFMTRECLAFYRMAMSMAPRSMRGSRELEVYALNSGAETIENMLKYLISRFNSRVGRPDTLSHRRFIVFSRSFHGRTVFALSMTRVDNRIATKDFHPLFRSSLMADFPAGVFSGFDPVEMHRYNMEVTARALDQVNRLIRRHQGALVGIVVEPIQSAGGHNVALPEFFRELSLLAGRRGIPVAYDEVQTGGGATGRTFYVDHLDLRHPPQALAAAKKFGVGVLYMLDHLRDVGVLDSTWGGPLVDMVRACHEMEIVRRERLVSRAGRTGDRLRRGLVELEERHPDCICNVRGLGLLQGFTVLPCSGGRARDLLLELALHRHLLLMLEAGRDSVRLRPNLSVTPADVDRFVGVLEDVLHDFCRRRPPEWEAEARQQRRSVFAFMRPVSK